MERTWREKIEGTTEQILAQIKRLIDEGNVRRVLVKQQGRVIAEFPLTVGVVGTVIAPLPAALGALTAVLAECSIEVEKTVPRQRRRPTPTATSRRVDERVGQQSTTTCVPRSCRRRRPRRPRGFGSPCRTACRSGKLGGF